MNTHHISDELPSLLTGDATRDVVLAAAEHLRSCIDCQQELVSAVIAHASLTSAHRFAPEIVARESDLAQQADDEPADVTPLPDMSSLFAEARASSIAEPKAAVHHTRRRLVAVAAAAAVVVGGGVTYAVVGTGDNGPAAPAGRTVALDGGGSRPAAKVVLVGDRMRLDAAALPALDGQHLYEVWLGRGDDRQSVGFLKSDRTVEISVPPSVMSRYDTIAVSVQQDGQKEFSGDVVLRGSYE